MALDRGPLIKSVNAVQKMNIEKRSLTTGEELKSSDYGPGSLSRAAAAFDSSSSESSDDNSDIEEVKSPTQNQPVESGPVSSVGHLSMMRAAQAFDSSESSEESDSESEAENKEKTVQLNDVEVKAAEAETFSPPMSLASLARANTLLEDSSEESDSDKSGGGGCVCFVVILTISPIRTDYVKVNQLTVINYVFLIKVLSLKHLHT